ncbi:MAG: DUF4349 domain-containing protein [Anaerolineales bacterium]|nr:DUF4349 domain-containing protein [Anaerolineales bacterium]
MNPKKYLILWMTVAAVLLAGCGPAATEAPQAAKAWEVEAPAAESPAEDSYTNSSEGSPASGETTLPSLSGPDYAPSDIKYTERMIIKNAELNLLVEDTDIAIDRATQVVADTGGYIISSRVWYKAWEGKNYKYASITIGVPASEFERAMRRFRELAIQVTDESASGEDVTDQFVDLQSRLENLEATRDRIREFLNQATTVEQALKVNEELAKVEAEIEQVQGRMNFLSDRSAYSTITVLIEPELPDPVIPATPTPTPTPLPPPWEPEKTLKQASKTVTSAYQGIFEMAIWFFIVVLPITAPPILVIWLVIHLFTRKRPKKPVIEN